MNKKHKWHSCAKWPKDLLSFSYADHDNTTRDGHYTESAAQAVANKLKKEGLGGEKIHFPIKVWVEPIKDHVRIS